MTSQNRRGSGLVVLALAGLALAVLPWLMFWQQLPANLPSHFGLDGRPDGWMSREALFAVILVFDLVGAIGLVTLAMRAHRMMVAPATLTGFLAGFFLGLGIGMGMASAIPGLGALNTSAAGALGPIVVVATSLLVGAIAARLAQASARKPRRDDASPPAPALTLAPGERAVWTGSASQPLWWALGGALIVGGVLALILTREFWGWLLIVVGLGIGATFARIRVQADHTGLTVRYTALAWPSTHIRLRSIQRATPIDVIPSQWGGWGYRGTVLVAGLAAVVVRKGPGLRLDLTDGRVFVVTVDDPEGAAAVLNAEVARRPGSGGEPASGEE